MKNQNRFVCITSLLLTMLGLLPPGTPCCAQPSSPLEKNSQPVTGTGKPSRDLPPLVAAAIKDDKPRTKTALSTNAPDGIIQVPLSGRVVETTNASGYTYLRVQLRDRTIWAAARELKVAVGDEVSIPQGWTMKDFKSKNLDRTFDWILFAAAVDVAGQAGKGQTPALPPGHPPTSSAHPPITTAKPHGGSPPEVKKGTIAKAPGGRTVEECHTLKQELAGKTVKIRGVVVKFNSAILGKNWIHIQDGSGAVATGDLTITTAETVKVGDTIVAEGKLSYDRHFGSGYDYAVLLEDAVISK